MNRLKYILKSCHKHYLSSVWSIIVLPITVFSLLVLNFMALDRLKNDVYGWNWYLCSHRTWLVFVGTALFTVAEFMIFKFWDRGFFINFIIIISTIYIFYICYHSQFGIWLSDAKKIVEVGIGLAILFYFLFGWIGFDSDDYPDSSDLDEGNGPDLNNEGIAGTYEDDYGNQYDIYGEPGNYYYYDDEGKGHHVYQNDPNAIFW